MTKKEKKLFVQAWLEAENLITLIYPEFHPEIQFKRPEDASPLELNMLLQFLRLVIKMLLHDKESTEREIMSLTNILNKADNSL